MEFEFEILAVEPFAVRRFDAQIAALM